MGVCLSLPRSFSDDHSIYAGRNVSSILLIGVEQAPLDESDVINGDARSISHDNLMFYPVQSSYLAGDRRITASGFFIVRNEIGDGDIRLFFYMALDNGKSGVNQYQSKGKFYYFFPLKLLYFKERFFNYSSFFRLFETKGKGRKTHFLPFPFQPYRPHIKLISHYRLIVSLS